MDTKIEANVDYLAQVEQVAHEAVRKAGDLVSSRFGGNLNVNAKDQAGRDLVTDVDRKSQQLISEYLNHSFPEHLVIGEEDPEGDERIATDWIWVIDPIDGTVNFANGLPIYAISVGALYRGVPMAGAVWTGLSGSAGGNVFHARRGAGAWNGENKLEVMNVTNGGSPSPSSIVALPSALHERYRIGSELRQYMGARRTLGSVALELCMVASGVLQYAISGPANSWDFAAGSLIVSEAGGLSLALDSRGSWHKLETFAQPYVHDFETTKNIRTWLRPVISGPEFTTNFISKNLRPKNRSLSRIVRQSLGL